MKRTATILAALLLSGCSTVGQIENRISCTLDGKQAFVNSMYGPIGVTSKIAPADAEQACRKP